MKKLIIALMFLFAPVLAQAAGGNAKLDPVSIDLGDRESLQNGARIFVNYCLGCHSAAYMRYNRMAADLGIPEQTVTENMLFAADKIGDLMKAVMPVEDAKAWFGVAPPDLTLVSRSRGADWIYTYLRSFYQDDKSPSGWNNVVFENVAMPHVLYEWQGTQKAVYETDGEGARHFVRFEQATPGTMDAETFDSNMRDLTNFFVYLGEPARLVRGTIGVWVLLFLAVLLVLAYLLKKEYWRDVH